MPDLPRTPQHERRARTRSALLAAAGRVFAERGYHGATLEDVVAEAGVSKGALYHYFHSKQELFLALLEELLGEGLDDAQALIAERGPEQEHVVLAAEGFLRRVGRDPRWLSLLLEFLAYGSRDPQVRAGVSAHFIKPTRRRIADLIQRHSPPGLDRSGLSAEELAVAAAALMNGLAIERAFDPAGVPDDLAGRVIGSLTAGVKAQTESGTRRARKRSSSSVKGVKRSS